MKLSAEIIGLNKHPNKPNMACITLHALHQDIPENEDGTITLMMGRGQEKDMTNPMLLEHMYIALPLNDIGNYKVGQILEIEITDALAGIKL